MSDTERQMLFCPIHGDYDRPEAGSQCPICAEDPIRSQASLRAVKVISTAEVPLANGDDEPTSIDDQAPCPSCGNLIPLSQFQSEAPGEVWEGEASLWAEEGVCPACYRDRIPTLSSEWSTEEWLTHHFEGWNSHVRRVSEIVEFTTPEQDSWLPEDQRQQILDVEKTLAARREHLARAQMRLREIKVELEVEELPERFAATMAAGRRALDERAVARLKQRREDDLMIERDRRVESVMAISPTAALREAGLDEGMVGGSGGDDPSEPSMIMPSPDAGLGDYDRGRWPLLVVVAAVLAFVIWWFMGR